MMYSKKRTIAILLVTVLALSLLLTACGNGGGTPTGDNSTPGTSSTPTERPDGGDNSTPGTNKTSAQPQNNEPLSPEDRQGGEFGGNFSNGTNKTVSYKGFTYFIDKTGSTLFKMAKDGSVTEIDISALPKSGYISSGLLSNGLVGFWNEKFIYPDGWLSIDGKQAGNIESAYNLGWRGNFIIGDTLYYAEGDIEHRLGTDNDIYKDIKTQEDADRAWEAYSNLPVYSGIVAVPMSEVFETPLDEYGEWNYTPSTVITTFMDTPNTSYLILFIEDEWIYYSAQKYTLSADGTSATDDNIIKIYRIKLDGTQENYIYEIDQLQSTICNFAGDYIYYLDGNPLDFYNLCRKKSDGSSDSEIIFSGVSMSSLNVYGDSLYFGVAGTDITMASGNPFYTGTKYIARLKLSDAVPGSSLTDIFAKIQRHDTDMVSAMGSGIFPPIEISNEWIFYTSYTSKITEMVKTDFSEEHDMPGQNSTQQPNEQGR